MSLINKVAISNMSNINGKGIQKWSPRFRYEVLNFHGQSAALNLVNGGGKTTLAEAMLALLSRDRKLVSNTKSKFSPSSSNVWSHFQIEVLVPKTNISQTDMLANIGEAVSGETWVFGMTGHCGQQESIAYYYFQGTLNDLPIGEKENNKTVLISNKQFKNTRQKIQGLKWAVDKTEWDDVISQHLSIDAIKQLVNFQKKGGSDKSAQLFRFKRRSGESYDATFFYEILAPAIMTDIMSKESEEDEHQLEDTIYETVMRVVRAKRKTEAKSTEVKKQEKTVEYLDKVNHAANECMEANDKYSKKLKEMALDVHVLTDLTKNTPIPGIPRASLFPEGLAGKLAEHIIIEPGQDEVRFTDRGLPLLTDNEPKHINQTALRNGINGRKITQVIDIPCDLEMKSPRAGGHAITSYTLKQTKELIIGIQNYAHNLTQQSVLEIIEEAELWFESQADTNSYRKTLVEAKSDLDYNKNISDELKTLIDGLYKEKDNLITQQREFKDNEATYNQLCQTGLFTDSELSKPKETKKQVEKEFSDAENDFNTFNINAAKLEEYKPAWKKYIKLHNQDNPHQVEEEYLNKKLLLKNQIDSTSEIKKSLDKEYKLVQKEISNITKQISEKETKLEQFKLLEPDINLYKKYFKNKNPEKLDRELINQHSSLKNDITQLETEKKKYEDLLESIKNFYKQINNDLAPSDWLDQTDDERKTLITESNTKKHKLSVLKRQLEELNKEKIAADETVQSALDILKNNALTHNILHKFILELDIPSKRKNQLLASFSSLLFAPVFKDKGQALKAVTLLHKEALPVPVFVADTLKPYCIDGNINEIEDKKLYLGLHAGIMTPQIKCLLNPELIEKEKTNIKSIIKGLDSELTKINKRLEEITPEGNLVKLARKAKKAIESNAEEEIKNIETAIDNKKVEIEKLLPLIEDHVIDAIKSMRQFIKMGGNSQLNIIEKEYTSLNKKNNANEEQKNKIEIDLNNRTMEVEKLQVELSEAYPSDIQNIIFQAKSFWDLNGPEFLNSEDELRKQLEATYSRAKERNDYKILFDRAQSYLDALASEEKGEDINKRITKIEKDIIAKKKEQEEANNKIKKLQDITIPDLKEVTLRIDLAASTILHKYKKIALLSEDVKIVELNNNEIQEHKLWSSANQLRDVISHSGAFPEIINQSQTVCDSSEEIDIDEKFGNVKRSKKEANETESKFIKEAHHAADVDDGLAPSEKERLKSVTSVKDAKRINDFHKEFVSILNKSQEELGELERGEKGVRAEVADHTSFMIHQAAHRLETMKTVVKRDYGNYKSHFIVKAEILDREGTSALIERIVLLLDTQEKHREEDKQKGTLIESDKSYKDNLRTKIKEQAYRSIFSEPSVKFVNERIRLEGKHDFDENLSEGEKTALSLMWTIRLAEFAIEVETKKLRTTTARKKARSRAENFLIIDGLFSNLSEPELIKSVMAGIEDTRGLFQLIGLIHHPHYENDYNVFPVLLLGKKHIAPDGKTGWVSFSEGKPVSPETIGNIEGSVGFAELTKIKQSDNTTTETLN